MSPAAGPWYISAAAVREFLAILGRTSNGDDEEWRRGERELVEMARAVAANLGVQRGRQVSPDLAEYRGPRPLRLRLRVSIATRTEGAKPQLVSVLPGHEGLRRVHPRLTVTPREVADVRRRSVEYPLALTRDVLDEIQRLAGQEVLTTNQWLIRAIEERMRRQHAEEK